MANTRLGVKVRRRLAAMATLGLVAGAMAATGPAQALAPTPVFAPPLTYEAGNAGGLVIADFTGDGRNDVLVRGTDTSATERPDRIYLFSQGPDGRLARTDAFGLDTLWNYGPGIAAGDLDGDGLTDAAVVSGTSIELLLQRGGTLIRGQAIPNAPFRWLEAADVTGDGRADIVGASLDGVQVLRNLGGATFAVPETLTTERQSDLQLGDVTGDGRADIVSCSPARGVMVFAQLAGGLQDHPGSGVCTSLTLADVNGDGRTDVAFVGPGYHDDRLVLLLQQADGTLAEGPSYLTGYWAEAVRAGDTNGDGRPDVVVLHGDSLWRLAVHTQAPDHTLDPGRLFDVPDSFDVNSPALAVGDVNGDDRPDIAVADNDQGLVVLLGRPAAPPTTTSTSVLPPASPYGPPPSTPDIFGAAQTYRLPFRGGAKSVAAGDFNGDGRTDLATVNEPLYATSLQVFVFYQGADGSLLRSVVFDTDAELDSGSLPINPSVVAGDLDGDGRDDLVLKMDRGVNIFIQRGGGFADRIYREVALYSRVDVADLDGDGRGDLVVSGPEGIVVHHSVGVAQFAAPITVDVGVTSKEVAIGDVSGDGRPDIVIAEDNVPNGDVYGNVVVYRQRADHSFAPGVWLGAGGRYGTVAVGDFNGDGRGDIAVSHSADRTVAVMVRIFVQGLGGTFTPLADELRHDSSAMPLRAGDVDGDGLTDLVAVESGGVLHAWVQRNGRLVPGQTRYLGYASLLPPTALALADFTGDGRLDVATANYNFGVEVLRNVTTSGAFHPLPPARILDTRTGLGAPAARLGAGGTISLQVAGAGGVPVGGATAVVLNVTVTEPAAGSFLTAWPTGENRPLASNLNFVAGQTVPNLVTVSTGLGGKVDLYNLAGSVHVIADVAGWYGVDYADVGSRYTPVTPARILDTRAGTGALPGKLGPSGTLGLQVTGRGGVPPSGVSSVVLNVTVTEPTAGSFLTAWPAGQSRPLASNLNYVAGQTVPNLVVVKVGAAGVVNIFNYAGATHVIADVAGWFGPGTATPTGSFSSASPVRIVDTRSGLGAPAAKMGPGGTLAVKVTDRAGLPPSGVAAVVLNVTVTEPSAGSFLTVWPHGEARPLASNLNFDAGQTVPNMVVVKVGVGGAIDLFNFAGATHVVVDVAGWYRA